MELTFQFKLGPTAAQQAALKATMQQVNAACNAIAAEAFAHKTSNKRTLQKEVYYEIRNMFSLSAQLTIRAIAKVAGAYKRDKTKKPFFKPLAGIAYDQRTLTWKGDTVSILTLDGREKIPVIAHGPFHGTRSNSATLVHRDGAFYLMVVYKVHEAEAVRVQDFLGVDFGVVNIASDSDGDTHSGGHLNGLRRRHAVLRHRLQEKGTKSAKRLLKKRKRVESRFARDVNHVISKRLVTKAKDTDRGIAIEDLTGIRDRITVRRAQRRVLHSWGFYQLRFFVEYKGRRDGVSVVAVDPRNTSRTCPVCGHVAKANRPTRGTFCCVICGFAGPADTIAAENIRRAAVNRPYAGACEHPVHALPASPGL